jgi:hypothetical protein
MISASSGERVLALGEHNVHVGTPGFDPRKGPPPRHMMAYEGAKQMHVDPTKVMRDPKLTTLTDVEKNVFGVDAKLHPITMMPLEQGSGALPPSQQAVGHFQTMCGQLRAMCERYVIAGDVEKAHIRREHEANAVHVAQVAEQLIEAGIVNKNALSMIPQL